ncbi:hypothetical protein M1N87_02030 [Dehalococcoidia bacterium]|nr:hypothetical protein [Dehalococcoidia bacterium]MCL0102926.1 hypothetical protein [Dehalococcoidia bacterium]
MRIEDIGRKLGDTAFRMDASGCNCARDSGSCGGCGSHANPNTIEPDNEKEDSESRR